MTTSAYQYPRQALTLCAEIIHKLTEIPSLPPTITLDDFHADICAKFDAIIKHCRRKSLPDSAAPELIYPLAALADETLLSNSKYRAYWTERPLQLRYFGEVIAGTKFFEKLEARIQAEEPNADILEAYFISLALGLKGMYGGEEAKRRAKIMERLGAMLTEMRDKNKKTTDAAGKPEKQPFPWRIWTSAALAAAAAALMIVTAVVRNAAVKNLVEFLGGI